MTRKIRFSIDEFYHIFNRGNNKSDIFLSDSDRKRFQKLLYVCNSPEPNVFKTIQSLALDKIVRKETLVDIGAYCLMPNHFHLVLREKVEDGISMFLQKTLTSYSKYFNKKYERTGTLFEGPLKAVHAETDEYLKYLFSYIHLNPVKMINPKWGEDGITNQTATKKYLEGYKYSSYSDYIGEKREEGIILNKNAFPEYFADFKEFDEFIKECLNYPREALE